MTRFNKLLSDKRKALLKNDHLACMWCACYLDDKTLTIEHIVPLGKGGKHMLENMGPACYECNHDRQDDLEWSVSIMRFGEFPKLYKDGQKIAALRVSPCKWAFLLV